MDTENLLDDLVERSNLVRRRALLPWWMKIFIWIFILSGAISIPVLIAGVLGMNVELAFYGMETHQSLSPVGLLILALYFLKGAVSYGLWAEEDWAITLGMIDGVIGLAVCTFVMFGLPYLYPATYPAINFRLEIVLLILYLMKLYRIKPLWEKR